MSEQRGKAAWGEYINDLSPRDDWWRACRFYPESFGQLFRLRGLIARAAAHAGTVGAMVWANADWKVIAAFGVPAILLLGMAIYARSLLVAACEADAALHLLMHQLRDRLNDVTTSDSPQSRVRAVKELYSDLCRQVAQFYRFRTGDAQLACCIRVMQVNDQNKEEFATRGRSDGLAAGRVKNSEPIAVDQGIVKAFLGNDGEGAYRIDNLSEAERGGIWKGTPNDNNFQDIKHVLVCAINGFYDKQKRMLGLLYLTSRSQPIQQIYWSSLEAIVDVFGAALPLLYDGGAEGRPASAASGESCSSSRKEA